MLSYLMARSGLTPRYVSNYQEPVDPSLCELVCGLESCSRTASSANVCSCPSRLDFCADEHSRGASGQGCEQRAAFVGGGLERCRRKH